MTKAQFEVREIWRRMESRGIKCDYDDVAALRRAEMTLHRWGELECGNGDDYKSWSIERDEATGKPHMCIYPHDGKARRYPVADREAGALRRIKAICDRIGAHFYHQTDPRGCALYIAAEPIQDNDYTRGVACCA